jgi:mRNA degradation ribonuclease J1/J2
MINSEIPIYVSKVTYDVLTQIAPLLPKQNTTNLNLHIIDGDIDFENIKVKAHRVDHSIAGATAYEIETDGKTIVYSGDIRFHGRASWQSSVFKRKIVVVRNPVVPRYDDFGCVVIGIYDFLLNENSLEI